MSVDHKTEVWGQWVVLHEQVISQCKLLLQLVLLRIPKSTPNPQIFPRVCLSPKPSFFAAVSDGFGSSVRETIFTYQIAVFKWCCVLLAAVVVGKGGAGSGTMVIGVVGSGRRRTVDQLSARDLPNVHGARCVINPEDAKVRFPAFNSIYTTAT